MSNKVKDIYVTNYTCYLCTEYQYQYKNILNINIQIYDPNNIKIGEKSFKNILICYIGYLTIKDLN